MFDPHEIRGRPVIVPAHVVSWIPGQGCSPIGMQEILRGVSLTKVEWSSTLAKSREMAFWPFLGADDAWWSMFHAMKPHQVTL